MPLGAKDVTKWAISSPGRELMQSLDVYDIGAL